MIRKTHHFGVFQVLTLLTDIQQSKVWSVLQQAQDRFMQHCQTRDFSRRDAGIVLTVNPNQFERAIYLKSQDFL